MERGGLLVSCFTGLRRLRCQADVKVEDRLGNNLALSTRQRIAQRVEYGGAEAKTCSGMHANSSQSKTGSASSIGRRRTESG